MEDRDELDISVNGNTAGRRRVRRIISSDSEGSDGEQLMDSQVPCNGIVSGSDGSAAASPVRRVLPPSGPSRLVQKEDTSSDDEVSIRRFTSLKQAGDVKGGRVPGNDKASPRAVKAGSQRNSPDSFPKECERSSESGGEDGGIANDKFAVLKSKRSSRKKRSRKLPTVSVSASSANPMPTGSSQPGVPDDIISPSASNRLHGSQSPKQNSFLSDLHKRNGDLFSDGDDEAYGQPMQLSIDESMSRFEDEDIEAGDLGALKKSAAKSSRHKQPASGGRTGKPKQPTARKKESRQSSKAALAQIQSETQRIIRQSRVSLPYHKPKQVTLAEFLEKRERSAADDGLNTASGVFVDEPTVPIARVLKTISPSKIQRPVVKRKPDAVPSHAPNSSKYSENTEPQHGDTAEEPSSGITEKTYVQNATNDYMDSSPTSVLPTNVVHQMENIDCNDNEDSELPDLTDEGNIPQSSAPAEDELAEPPSLVDIDMPGPSGTSVSATACTGGTAVVQQAHVDDSSSAPVPKPLRTRLLERFGSNTPVSLFGKPRLSGTPTDIIDLSSHENEGGKSSSKPKKQLSSLDRFVLRAIENSSKKQLSTTQERHVHIGVITREDSEAGGQSLIRREMSFTLHPEDQEESETRPGHKLIALKEALSVGIRARREREIERRRQLWKQELIDRGELASDGGEEEEEEEVLSDKDDESSSTEAESEPEDEGDLEELFKHEKRLEKNEYVDDEAEDSDADGDDEASDGDEDNDETGVDGGDRSSDVGKIDNFNKAEPGEETKSQMIIESDSITAQVTSPSKGEEPACCVSDTVSLDQSLGAASDIFRFGSDALTSQDGKLLPIDRLPAGGSLLHVDVTDCLSIFSNSYGSRVDTPDTMILSENKARSPRSEDGGNADKISPIIEMPDAKQDSMKASTQDLLEFCSAEFPNDNVTAQTASSSKETTDVDTLKNTFEAFDENAIDGLDDMFGTDDADRSPMPASRRPRFHLFDDDDDDWDSRDQSQDCCDRKEGIARNSTTGKMENKFPCTAGDSAEVSMENNKEPAVEVPQGSSEEIPRSGEENDQRQLRRLVVKDDDDDDDDGDDDKGDDDLDTQNPDRGIADEQYLDEDDDGSNSDNELDDDKERGPDLNESDDELAIVRKLQAEKRGVKQLVDKDGKMRREFVEEEAELSGSEVDPDENYDIGSDEDEYEAEDGDLEDLPSDEELRRQIGRIHNKQMLDEDKRRLLAMKEAYLEDGELHSDSRRMRRFKWREGDDDADEGWWNQDELDDDEIEGGGGGGDPTQIPSLPNEDFYRNSAESEKEALERKSWLETNQLSDDADVIIPDNSQPIVPKTLKLGGRLKPEMIPKPTYGRDHTVTMDSTSSLGFPLTVGSYDDDNVTSSKDSKHRESLLGRGKDALERLTRVASWSSNPQNKNSYSRCVFSRLSPSKESRDATDAPIGFDLNSDADGAATPSEPKQPVGVVKRKTSKISPPFQQPKRPKLFNENSNSIFELL